MTKQAHTGYHNSQAAGVHGLTGSVVGTTDAQTLTNKTLTSPTLTAPLITDAVLAGTTVDTTFLVVGSSDATKRLRFEVDGFTTETTRVLTPPDEDATIVGVATTQTLTNKTLTSPVLTTPTLGVASATTVNKVAITAPATGATLTIPDGVTLTGPAASGTVATLAGTETLSNKAIIAKNSVINGDGSITIASGTLFITKGSACLLSIAAPSSNDGVEITLISTTDFAHVVTFTGSTFADGTTGLNQTCTFAAFAGASMTFVAKGVLWYAKSLVAVTPTA